MARRGAAPYVEALRDTREKACARRRPLLEGGYASQLPPIVVVERAGYGVRGGGA